MNCPECDRPLWSYDEQTLTCKAGHHWVSDDPPEVNLTSPRPVVNGRRWPAWVPGAVLGGVALLAEAARWLS